MSLHMVGGPQIFLDTGRDMGQKYESHLKSHLEAKATGLRMPQSHLGGSRWLYANSLWCGLGPTDVMEGDGEGDGGSWECTQVSTRHVKLTRRHIRHAWKQDQF
jgi:hypothetical protein